MIFNNIDKLEFKEVNYPTAKDASMAVMAGSVEGWEDHVMRVLSVGKDGYTPKHSHPWPHINYVIDGEGEILIDGEYRKATKGFFAVIDANTEHQFRNTSDKPFRFICIVPKEGHK